MPFGPAVSRLAARIPTSLEMDRVTPRMLSVCFVVAATVGLFLSSSASAETARIRHRRFYSGSNVSVRSVSYRPTAASSASELPANTSAGYEPPALARSELGDYRFGFVRPARSDRRVRKLSGEERASYRRTRAILRQLGELRPYDAFRNDHPADPGTKWGNAVTAREASRKEQLVQEDEGFLRRTVLAPDTAGGSLYDRIAAYFDEDPFGFRGQEIRTRIADLSFSGANDPTSPSIVGIVDRFENGNVVDIVNELSHHIVEGTFALFRVAGDIVFPVSTAHATHRPIELSSYDLRRRLESVEHSYQRDGLARF